MAKNQNNKPNDKQIKKNKANTTLTNKHKIYSEKTAPSGSVYIDYLGNICLKGANKATNQALRAAINKGKAALDKLYSKNPKLAEKYWKEYQAENKKYTSYRAEYKTVMKDIDDGKDPFAQKKEEVKTDPKTESQSPSTDVNSPETQNEKKPKKENAFTKKWKENTQKAKEKQQKEFEEKVEELKDEYYSKYDSSNLADGDVVYDPRIPGFVWKGKSAEVQRLLNENFKKLTKDKFIEKYKKAGFFGGSETAIKQLYENMEIGKKDSLEVEKKYNKAYKSLKQEYEVSEYSNINKAVHSVTDQLSDDKDTWGETISNLGSLAGKATDAVTGFMDGDNAAAVTGAVGLVPGLIGLGKNIYDTIATHYKNKKEKEEQEFEELKNYALGGASLDEAGFTEDQIDKIEEYKNQKKSDKEKEKTRINKIADNILSENSKLDSNYFNDEEFETQLIKDKLNQFANKEGEDEDDDYDDNYGVINPGLNVDKIKSILTENYNDDTPENSDFENEDTDEESGETSNENQTMKDKFYNFMDAYTKNKDMNSAFDPNNILDYANYLSDVKNAKKDENYLLSRSKGKAELENYNNAHERNVSGDSGTLALQSYATQNDENERAYNISKDFITNKKEALEKFRNLSKENKEKFLERYQSFVNTKEGLEEFRDVVASNIFDPARNEKLSIIDKALETKKQSQGSEEDRKFKNAVERTKLLGYVSNAEDAELLGTNVGAKDQKTSALQEKLNFEKYLEDNKYEMATEKQKQQMVRDYLKDSLSRDKMEADMNKFTRMADDKYDLGKEGINARRYAAELGLQGKQDMGRLRKEGQMYSADVGKERALDVANIARQRAYDVAKLRADSSEKINAEKLKSNLTIAELKDLTNRYGIDFKYKGAMNALASKERIESMKLIVDERLKDKELSSEERRQLRQLQNNLDVAALNAASAETLKNIDAEIAAANKRADYDITQMSEQYKFNTTKMAEEIKQNTAQNTSKTYYKKQIADSSGLTDSLKKGAKNIADNFNDYIYGTNKPTAPKKLAKHFFGKEFEENWPVREHSRVTVGFGKKGHAGIDIAPSESAKGGPGPVIYSLPGTTFTVEKVVTGKKHGDPSYGNFVKLRTPSGQVIIYAHLHSVSPHIKVGKTINGITNLGVMGNSGNSHGTHLHLEFRDASGRAVNPKEFVWR